MDLLEQALGPFDWDNDPDIAVRLCLLDCGQDHSLTTLVDFLPDHAKFGGVAGETGILERRDDGSVLPYYAAWPQSAKYCASVDPDEFRLGTPEGFYTRAQFMPFVHATVTAYLSVYPDRKRGILPLLTLLEHPDFALPEPASPRR